MLILMYRSGKRAASEEEVAEALGIPRTEVSALYRGPRDQGWVNKFADGPGMFELTGPGRGEARRLLSERGNGGRG